MRKDVEKAFKSMCRTIDDAFGDGTTEGWKISGWNPGEGWIRRKIERNDDGLSLRGAANDYYNHHHILVALNFTRDMITTIIIQKKEAQNDHTNQQANNNARVGTAQESCKGG